MNYLSKLSEVIRELHGCSSRHKETVEVKEVFQGQVLWEGKVEVFELLNHTKTKTAYAWGYVDDKGQSQFVAVLGVPPVDTPQRAVKASIAARLKAGRN